ncbi:MAG TPA: hypothetical protein VK304_13110 [Thermoleophilaceae bacterium]|nr:hypothetical protein [Thermoleophilaceae bacterium]
MADEWRVEINLDDPEHGYGLGERLRSRHLDDETRERLGNRVVVTRDGPRLFLYAATQSEAREAERVVRELIEHDDLSAEVATTRWHPDEEAWEDASRPLPSSEDERAAERERASGEDWEVRIELTGLTTAVELERDLIDEGLSVERRFAYLMIGAATEEGARELAERFRAELPEGTPVHVEPNMSEVPDPRFVMFDRARPGFARDLGL